MRHISVLLAPLIALAAAHAARADDDLLRAPSIARMAQIPGLGLQAVETTDGKLVLLSLNGRFALYGGTVVDLWQGKRLASFDEAQASGSHLDLARLGLDPADLGAITVGTGPATLIFYDPHCPHCQDLLGQLAGLTDRFQFHLVALPILGGASVATALALACQAQSEPAAVAKRLLERDFANLPAATGNCGQQPVQRALVTAQMLGIQGVPYLIGPHGAVTQGAPRDLVAWLTGTGAGDTPAAPTPAISE